MDQQSFFWYRLLVMFLLLALLLFLLYRSNRKKKNLPLIIPFFTILLMVVFLYQGFQGLWYFPLDYEHRGGVIFKHKDKMFLIQGKYLEHYDASDYYKLCNTVHIEKSNVSDMHFQVDPYLNRAEIVSPGSRYDDDDDEDSDNNYYYHLLQNNEDIIRLNPSNISKYLHLF